MSKSFNNKNLLIVFVVLLVVVLLTQFTDWGGRDRSFRKHLVEIDTGAVEQITIYSGRQGMENLVLAKNGNKWQVKRGERTEPAAEDKIGNALRRLENVEVQRLVARQQEQWPEYEVTDSLGTRIQVQQDGENALDLILGKFSFDRASRSATTFVRLASGNTVYAVDGMLKQSITDNINDWRDRTVIKGNDAYWNKLTFTYPADSGFVLSKNNDQWTVNGNPADSASTVKYLNKLTTIRNPDFADDFEGGNNPAFKLTINSEQSPSTINIEGYNTGTEGEFVIHSDLNPNAYFKAPRDGLFTRIFPGKEQLLTSSD